MTHPVEPEHPHAQLALDAIVAASRFTRAAAQTAGGNQSAVALRVLAMLKHSDGVRVSELANEQRVSQPTMTVLIDRLEREGLVQRHKDPNDRRATLVSVTEAGAASLETFTRNAAAHFAPRLQALPAHQRKVLAEAIEVLHTLSNCDHARTG